MVIEAWAIWQCDNASTYTKGPFTPYRGMFGIIIYGYWQILQTKLQVGGL